MSMTTTTPIRGSAGRSPAVRPDERRTCGCGQEIDACRRAHCPRCGHRLRAPARAAAAAAAA